jgi:hypothetical protein
MLQPCTPEPTADRRDGSNHLVTRRHRKAPWLEITLDDLEVRAADRAGPYLNSQLEGSRLEGRQLDELER